MRDSRYLQSTTVARVSSLIHTQNVNCQRRQLRQECRDLEGEKADQVTTDGQRQRDEHDQSHHSTRRPGQSFTCDHNL